MSYQGINANEVENIGPFDRVNRLVLGLTAIMAAVFTAIPEAAVAKLVAIGIYAGLTALIGWDPLYALIRIGRPEAPLPTTPKKDLNGGDQNREPSPEEDDFKKAA